MNNDLIYIAIIAFIFFIILGLYLSQNTKLNISEKEKILMENFSPQVSSTTAQAKGSSQLYRWGLPQDNASTIKEIKEENCSDDDIPPFTPKPVEPTKCKPVEDENCNPESKKNCYDCDILTNKDINKYVLKSSVPPCPDTSKFITKNMMHSCPDMTKYILKSEIPKCERFDKSKYILKSEIPPCPKCPICPVCPVCPVCPKPVPQKTINQYKIEEHPDLKNYVKKDDLKNVCKNYVEDEIKNKKDEIKDKIEKRINEEDGTYSNMLDKIFESGSDLKKSNNVGLYAGDSLYSAF
jgi:hypothetical protein